MDARIINTGNGVNRSTNTLSSQRDAAVVNSRIVNEGNGTNDSVNIIHNQADTLYATNQIINVYDYPDWPCNPPPNPFPGGCYGWNPWSVSSCVPWCSSPWPCCCGIWGGYFPALLAMAVLPFLIL